VTVVVFAELFVKLPIPEEVPSRFLLQFSVDATLSTGVKVRGVELL